jgi:hypothetical protein
MLAALDQEPPSRARHHRVLQAACDSQTCSVAAGIHRLPLAVSPLPPATVSPVSRHCPVNKREQTGPAEPRGGVLGRGIQGWTMMHIVRQ